MTNNKFSRIVVSGDDYRSSKLEGARLAKSVAKAAYGIGAGNILIERNYGAPITSRDGVSNLEQLHVSDPVQNMVIQTIVQASQRTNQHAGDGTTATAILAAELYEDGVKSISDEGLSPIQASNRIRETARKVYSFIENKKLKANKKDLRNIAHISSGDNAIGDMISLIFDTFGGDGGVVVSAHDGDDTTLTIESGFYFKKGLTLPSQANNPSLRESYHTNVPVVVVSKTLKSSNDLIGIFDKIGSWAEEQRRVPLEFILCADVEGEALAGLYQNDRKFLSPTLVAPYGVNMAQKESFLEDIATYTGAKVISSNNFDPSYIGNAQEAIVTPYTTNIIGGAPQEDIQLAVNLITKQLAESDSPVDVAYLKERQDRLLGKIATISVGGETEEVRIEKKLRVDDAVNAVRSAHLYGILPGEAKPLRVAASAIEHAEPYGRLFEYLLENCGMEYKNVDNDLLSVFGDGFDISSGSAKVIDLRKSGIVDPLQVVLETIKNASAVAALLVTSTTGMFYENRDVKQD